MYKHLLIIEIQKECWNIAHSVKNHVSFLMNMSSLIKISQFSHFLGARTHLLKKGKIQNWTNPIYINEPKLSQSYILGDLIFGIRIQALQKRHQTKRLLTSLMLIIMTADSLNLDYQSKISPCSLSSSRNKFSLVTIEWRHSQAIEIGEWGDPAPKIGLAPHYSFYIDLHVVTLYWSSG